MKDIGTSKLSEVLPYLKNVAFTYGLNLNRAKEFKMARMLLANLYNQN